MQKQPFANVLQSRYVLKNFAIFTGKHLCWSIFLIKLLAFRCFPVNIPKLLRAAAFFIEHLRWLLLQMFCFKLHFQKSIAEYIVVLHCIIVAFWNIKSFAFAFIRCTTRSHSLPLVAIHCHSLHHLLSLVVTRCTTRISFYKRSKKTNICLIVKALLLRRIKILNSNANKKKKYVQIFDVRSHVTQEL